MISDIDLWERLQRASFPRLGEDLGDFLLYDSIVAGYAHRLVERAAFDSAALEFKPDDETLRFVSELRSKTSLSDDEQEFLEYYSLLDDLRDRIRAAARAELGV